MTDVVDPQTRSRMMSGIRGKNTKPEMLVRSALHRRGFRFKLHDKTLPGKPDIVLPRYRAVINIHGCFWHGHTGCKYFRIPATRTEFWNEKITGNRLRDQIHESLLLEQGWRVLTVWECALRGRKPVSLERVTDLMEQWLEGRFSTGTVEETTQASPLLKERLEK